MFLFDAFLLGIGLGIWGYVVAAILTEPGEILDFWPPLVSRVLYGEPYAAIQSSDWRGRIAKILWACPKCHAGQWGFWYYLAFRWHNYQVTEHLIVVGCAIIVAYWLQQRFAGS